MSKLDKCPWEGCNKTIEQCEADFVATVPVTHKLFCETAGCGNEATNFVAGHELCDDCFRKEAR
jgi:hypothetical protein